MWPSYTCFIALLLLTTCHALAAPRYARNNTSRRLLQGSAASIRQQLASLRIGFARQPAPQLPSPSSSTSGPLPPPSYLLKRGKWYQLRITPRKSSMSAESIAAAAADRLADKEPSDILGAAAEGDVARIADHLAVDPSRVNVRDG